MEIAVIENEKVPYDLLFLTDEDDKQISKYRYCATFLAAEEESEIVGIIGLQDLGEGRLEIVNVAVSENRQRKGIGTQLIEKAIAHAKEKACKEILIKTGDCGIGQLALYQRCGFRYNSINKDYFSKYYPAPIYENGIRAVDQIILSYKVYSPEELETEVKRYWNRFTERNPQYKGKAYEVWNFCYGEYLPNKLLGLVKMGDKTGTSSAAELYEEDERRPEEGDLSIVTYGNGLPGCIIETKEIRLKKYKEIGEEEARLEGEGDLSLDYWRQAHEWFFKLEYTECGKTFTEDIPVIFERFEVVYDEDRKESAPPDGE